jgi:PBP1b-binding outer membrane lipoprotein LpoB
MKKIASIAAIALFAVAFTSCKKEYTCSCKYDMNGTQQTVDVKSGTKLSKKDAKTWCEGYKVSGWTGITCSLK